MYDKLEFLLEPKLIFRLGKLSLIYATVAPGFKNKTRYTPYVSPRSQISHIATNKSNIIR